MPKPGHLRDNFPQQHKRLRELNAKLAELYAEMEDLYNALAEMDPKHASTYRLMAKPYGTKVRMALRTV